VSVGHVLAAAGVVHAVYRHDVYKGLRSVGVGIQLKVGNLLVGAGPLHAKHNVVAAAASKGAGGEKEDLPKGI
jgi:hypothetical protein